ncbi:MAG: Nramp family divalent metal transporter [Bacteroidota bacterium]
MNQKIRKLLRTLGPGILFASTCIGVSHLVQSTRAGADYGFAMLWAVILANVFKYPFFEFASRYTSATGISILDGYRKKGKWILIIYLMITIISMFIVTAAVTFITAGLLGNLLGLEGENVTANMAALVLGVCVLILAIGRYSTLDNLLKLVATVLVVSTFTAFFSALFFDRPPIAPDFVPKDEWSSTGITFLIALMGWMPTAVDVSTWTSLWAEAKIKQSGYRPTLKEASFDFNLGYWASAVMAILFLSLGAFVIYGRGNGLPNSSPAFANELIRIFTSTIGDWSYFVIAVAAFSTMFSTTITVIDGYGRAMTRSVKLLMDQSGEDSRKSYLLWTVLMALGGFIVVSQFLNNLKQLVDLATILSFVVAPLAGYLNYNVIFSKEVGDQFRPPKWLKVLAIAGLVFLSIFTIIYFYTLL